MRPKLTSEFAELIGIIFGDGYMNHYSNGHYYIEIAGHLENDFEYHTNHITNLSERIFNIRPTLVIRKGQKTIYSRISSKIVFNNLKSSGVPQ